MKYLNTGGFDYANELRRDIERHHIPEPIDCVMGKWTDWTACNSPGGGSTGMQERTRKQIIDPQHGGVPCNEMTYESRKCTMPVVEEPLPPVATVPVISPVTHPAIIEAEKLNPIDIFLGWINMDGGLQDTVVAPTVPVQVDGGTGQGTLLPEQTTPIAPAETTPVVTEEPAETTVVEETVAEEIPCCPPYCPEGADCGPHEPCQPNSVPCEPTVVETVVETITEGVTTVVDGITDIFTPETSEEPVVEDTATTQDSVLPAQDSTPDTTSETPSPAEVTVNIVQQPASSGGGGGTPATAPAATTTETKEETKDDETTTEEPEEGSNALKIVGGLAVLSGIGYWAYQKYA